MISVNGFVSTSYSYNLNRPASGTNRYRVFDFDDNTFKLDVAELVLQRAVSKAGDVGFRVDATAGGSIPRVAAASGLFRDPATGAAEDFDLQQAFVSWVAPVGRGLRLDVGKMVTTAGYEVVEGYDGFNDNATRSFLFAYAEPVTHTGMKAAYAFSDTVSANVMVVNGWDNVKDNNCVEDPGGRRDGQPEPDGLADRQLPLRTGADERQRRRARAPRRHRRPEAERRRDDRLQPRPGNGGGAGGGRRHGDLVGRGRLRPRRPDIRRSPRRCAWSTSTTRTASGREPSRS